VVEANEEQVDQAITAACQTQRSWNLTPAVRRAEILEKTADLFGEHMAELIALCVREAGKSVPDSVSEWREAVDFLRYYAVHCRQDFAGQIRLPGPTGELNQISLHGRGVFVCISPWNFPLAIFTGQVAAALAAGNTVLAKPAEQTPLVAALVVRLLHKAGVPAGALHFLPGAGASVGARAVADPRVAGVAFTGSTDTARLINQTLAARAGPIGCLIAETGGQNTMIVDSSALPEQVVRDVVTSAFNSAGQRCSALRVLFLQKEIAPRVIQLLKGYMDELIVGDPALLSTDVGPVIDREALGVLEQHISAMAENGTIIHRCKVANNALHGSFLAPVVVEIDDIGLLEKEVFGPVLHIVRYEASQLDKVLEQISQTGYGLTLGVHSRIDGMARYINRRVQVGNVYVNRNMVGAVVGVQPFGGCGLSGTGPKAGGPHYLHRFATERTLTINTAAVGGDTGLLSLSSDRQE
jgi:RHH-type proline utilization regulon transcriptional repressor/proline dehydrogenase/delta 1-pyrroline-5-carboxylate dehydrogenase